jgi:hypothetical protein
MCFVKNIIFISFSSSSSLILTDYFTTYHIGTNHPKRVKMKMKKENSRGRKSIECGAKEKGAS